MPSLSRGRPLLPKRGPRRGTVSRQTLVNKEKLKEGRRLGPEIKFPICWCNARAPKRPDRSLSSADAQHSLCRCAAGDPPVPDDMPPSSNARREVGPATSGYAAPSQAPRPTRGWTGQAAASLVQVLGALPTAAMSEVMEPALAPTTPPNHCSAILGPALADDMPAVANPTFLLRIVRYCAVNYHPQLRHKVANATRHPPHRRPSEGSVTGGIRCPAVPVCLR